MAARLCLGMILSLPAWCSAGRSCREPALGSPRQPPAHGRPGPAQTLQRCPSMLECTCGEALIVVIDCARCIAFCQVQAASQ